MKQVSISVTIIVAVVAFAAGFWFANTLNRAETTSVQPSGVTSNTTAISGDANSQDVVLTEEEITAKIREADQNSGNFAFQKGLGLGLYRYGAMKEDKSVIERSIPILERANSLDAKDVDVLVGLGNAHFDVGYFGKNNQSFENARSYYSKALSERPKDVDVRTDVGLSYYLEQPPRYAEAISEFQKALEIEPKHEKTLGFLIRSLDSLKRDSSKYKDVLRTVNPQNPALQSGQSPK